MTYPLILRPEAEKDLLDAFRWYDERVPGLGLRFLESVELTLTQIQHNPKAFAAIHEGVRRALIRTFPYGIYYALEDEGASFWPYSIALATLAYGKREPPAPDSRAPHVGADWPPNCCFAAAFHRRIALSFQLRRRHFSAESSNCHGHRISLGHA